MLAARAWAKSEPAAAPDALARFAPVADAAFLILVLEAEEAELLAVESGAPDPLADES
jgi:hypothetical protein